MNFEDRLGERLSARAEQTTVDGLKGVDELRVTAGARTRRNRAVIGLLASTLIVGIGGFAATEWSRNQQPATSDVAIEVVDNREDEASVDGSAAASATSTPAGGSVLASEAEVAQFSLGLANGQSLSAVIATDVGYVAFADSSGPVIALRSDDARSWESVETGLPAGLVQAAGFHDGLYSVAIVGLPDTTLSVGTQQAPDPTPLYIATSRDLVDWLVSAVHPTLGDGSGRSFYPSVRSMTVADAGVLLSLERYPSFDSSDDLRTAPEPVSELWFSDGDNAFSLIEGPPFEDPGCQCVTVARFADEFADEFVAFDPLAGVTYRSFDAVSWRTSPLGDQPFLGSGVVASRGDEVLLGGPFGDSLTYSDDGGLSWSTPVSLRPLVDLPANREIGLDALLVDDSGWIASTTVFTVFSALAGSLPDSEVVEGDQFGQFEVRVDGFTVTGSLFSDVSTVVADDGSFSHVYSPPADNPIGAADGVVDGLFSGVRFLRPGTDDILLSVSAEELQEAYEEYVQVPGAVPGLPDRQIDVEVDGWRLAGSMSSGPLELTDPGGNRQAFTDGFAFTNGSLADGVEIEPPLSGQNDPRDDAAEIMFVDADGAELVRFSFWDAVASSLDDPENMSAPSLEELVGGALPPTSVTRGGYTVTFHHGEVMYELLDNEDGLLVSSPAGADALAGEIGWITFDGIGDLDIVDPRTGDLAMSVGLDELGPGGVPETVILFSEDGRNWSVLDRLAGRASVAIDGSTVVVVGSFGGESLVRRFSLD